MQDEGVTPPDVTALLRKYLLSPARDEKFDRNMDTLRDWLRPGYGTAQESISNATYDSHNIGTMIAKQINCTINGMKVSPQEAAALTLEKLANTAFTLGNYSNQNAETAQERDAFLRCFLPRVGFDAGFSKNAENKRDGQIACFDNKSR